MARKQKEQPITVTHAEVLGFAIQRVGDFVMKEEAQAKEFDEKAPEFAEKIRTTSIWRKKLKILLQMYRFEVGDDYNSDFDVDLG